MASPSHSPAPISRRTLLQRAASVAAVGPALRLAQLVNTADAQDRLQWWREARFGMFVHFGLYSGPGGMWNGKFTGSHEWMRNNARIPHEDYIRLANTFNPRSLDVEAIVRLAKEAGQKYIVVTTKHHEGFALFDSAVSDYDVMATPYGRDIMRQFADACRVHGLRLGWYYSIMDWYHPDYLPRRDWESRDGSTADFRRYVAFMHAQLRELLTGYGDISILWFDGQWEPTWTPQLGRATYDLCRSLQPGIVVNNRVDVKREGSTDRLLGEGQAGDFSTPELEIPATGLPGQDWESCMTMNDNWGYAGDDNNWKSPATLIGMLVDTASKGGNLLLNIGPDGAGTVPQPSVDGLRAMGAWLKVNGEAIYASRASLIATPEYRTTTQSRAINCFVDRWRPGAILLSGVHTRVDRAWLLADRGTSLAAENTPAGVRVTLPDRPSDPICSVIRIAFRDEPRLGA